MRILGWLPACKGSWATDGKSRSLIQDNRLQLPSVTGLNVAGQRVLLSKSEGVKDGKTVRVRPEAGEPTIELENWSGPHF